MGDGKATADHERAIAATRAAFVDALRQGDARTVARIYASTARLVPPSTDPIEGRDAIEAFWQAGLDSGVVDVELQAATVEPAGRLAYEVGRYVLRLRSAADELIVDRGVYVLVLARQPDGLWRRVVEVLSPVPAR